MKRVESRLIKESTHKAFAKKVKKEGTTMSAVINQLIINYLKK